jgi:hypothetical protein
MGIFRLHSAKADPMSVSHDNTNEMFAVATFALYTIYSLGAAHHCLDSAYKEFNTDMSTTVSSTQSIAAGSVSYYSS